MDRGLYVAMGGAKQLAQSQRVVSNNIANVGTTGFKQDLSVALSQTVHGPGYESRVYGTHVNSTFTDTSAGPLKVTGRELDVAVDGPGYIGVQAADGTTAYTRRGDLQITPNGLLTTGDGIPVMGNAGPIAIPPNQKLEIGSDGTISIVPLGQPPNTTAIIDRIQLASAQGTVMAKTPEGLLRPEVGPEPVPDAQVKLLSGTLEGSNVNAVSEMVDMIEIQRQFEMQVRMMRTVDENAEQANTLLQIG